MEELASKLLVASGLLSSAVRSQHSKMFDWHYGEKFTG